MSKELLNDIQSYLSTVPNNSENQTIHKQKKKTGKTALEHQSYA